MKLVNKETSPFIKWTIRNHIAFDIHWELKEQFQVINNSWDIVYARIRDIMPPKVRDIYEIS